MNTFEQIEKFYTTLFGPTERICWSEDTYGTTISAATNFAYYGSHCFFTINPLKDRRCDANVSALRNILLEFDDVPLAEQLKIIAEIPHTTVVFSGGKSYHAIISLVEPCVTREEYDKLVRRIYDRVPGVDRQNSNPSRFSRSPEAPRDNGYRQDLITVRNRISRLELETWLGPDTVEEVESCSASPVNIRMGLLNPHTLYFLNFGADAGHWNRQLFLSALDMARCGRSEFEIVQQLTKVTGKLDNGDRRTIRSAINIVAKE